MNHPTATNVAPASTDVVVRADDSEHYWVERADYHDGPVGPFDRPAYALGVAHSLAWQRRGRVWLARDGGVVLLADIPSH